MRERRRNEMEGEEEEVEEGRRVKGVGGGKGGGKIGGGRMEG